MIGRTIAQYQIVDKLGEGGMGVVYKALDTRLSRTVVLKVLRADQLADPDRRRRFKQEAQAASALSHPNIITVHDIVTHDDLQFIVMEYVPGQPLDYMIPSGGLSLSDALFYALQIADALEAAHSAGIIHRDLKPGNVMITPGGLVKLLDFGLVKLTSGWSGAEATGPRTVEGSIVGTICYMSPEQALSKPLDRRSDIFSFGTVLYEMVTGRRAFGDGSSLAALTAVLRDPPKNPIELRPELPAEAAAIIMRCLEKDPVRRFPTASAVRQALSGVSIPGTSSPGNSQNSFNDGQAALERLSVTALNKARTFFEQAIRQSGDHECIYAGMSEYYASLALRGLRDPSDAVSKAIWAARKANGSEQARVTMGLLRANFEFKWHDARPQLETIRTQSSRMRRALWYLRPLGCFEEAVADLQGNPAGQAWVALEAGDIVAAERNAAAADLQSWIGCWVRAWALVAAKRFREAVETSRAALSMDPGNAYLEGVLAAALVLNRQPEAARKVLDHPHWRPLSYSIPYCVAIGDLDRAFEVAAEAVSRRDPCLLTTLRLPNMGPMRADMRYAELLAAMRLPG